MRIIITLWLYFSFSSVLLASTGNVTGKWRTVDDLTGEVKAIVEINERGGKLYGTVIKVFNNPTSSEPLCIKCKGKFRNNPIIGMQIIDGLTQVKGKWRGKKGILDPDNGKFYNVRIWNNATDPDQLHVRGYLFFIFRTQTWLREE